MLPADCPCLSLSRTSPSEVHFALAGKKKAAASSAMSQSSRKRTGQVTATRSPSFTLQTPSGSLALSFVQFGTLLLKGQRRFSLYLTASGDRLSTGKPKTSARRSEERRVGK